MVPLSHNSNVYAARSKTMAEVDLVILLGRKLDYQLAFGSPAIFKKAKFIRISDIADELLDNRRGNPEILASPGVVLEDITRKIGRIKLDEKWKKI